MFTYIHNKKVEPAPVVGEIFLEAICNPFEEHLQHKDVGEDLVGRLQHHLYDFSLLNVDIFKCLQQKTNSSMTTTLLCVKHTKHRFGKFCILPQNST